MNILDILGVAICFGIIGGKIFQKFKIPQVVGYIFLGLIIGRSLLHVFETDVVESLTPVVNFTLGVIGLVIGGELKFDVFRKYGKSIYYMMFSEGLLAFVFVAIGVFLITRDIALGLLLGAIASATDPASTVNVLWEYKGKGPLTTTVTSIVALDDGLALVIYGLASVFAKSILAHEAFSFFNSVGKPLIEIGSCIILGAVFALLVIAAIKLIKEKELLVALVIGFICAVVGLSIFFHLDLILSSMAMGCVIANVLPEESEKLFKNISDMSLALYVLFFVIIGAQLDIHIFLQSSIVALVLIYVVARSGGKFCGAFLGGTISKTQKSVKNYAGLCLLTQGGVAMGLAISINHNLAHVDGAAAIGTMVMNVIAATTFIVQIFGPLLVKFAVHKAGEAGRNVTKNDIIEALKVEDVMQKDISVIQEGNSLREIIKTVQERESYHFPVSDNSDKLTGTISLNELRHAFLEEGLHDIILAADIALPVKDVFTEKEPLKSVLNTFEKRSLDYIPVVNDTENLKVVGILEKNILEKTLNRLLLERQAIQN